MSRAIPGKLLSTVLLLSLAACAGGALVEPGTNGATASVADGAPFTLQTGQAAVLADGSRLQYLRVVDDSRCPPDVQCVWAGDAVAAFLWAPAHGASQRFQLHTGVEPRSQAIGARSVTLLALAHGGQPQASMRVDTTP